jgi:DNA-binding PucR family transcriptional regulator
VLDGVGCVFLSDPEGPGRIDQLRRAAAKVKVALGPATDPAEAAKSWELAKALLVASTAGAIDGTALLRAEDHLADLLLAASPLVTSRISARRLAPLGHLTERARERMRETALAYVRHHSNAVAMADELHVHPQTARYRIARLRELFGEELDDPDARFELEIALRVSVPR